MLRPIVVAGIAAAITTGVPLSLIAIGKVYAYMTKRSLFYLGETKEFERKLSIEYGGTDVVGLQRMMRKYLVLGMMGDGQSDRVLEECRKKYPDVTVPYVLQALHDSNKGEEEGKCQGWIDKANAINNRTPNRFNNDMIEFFLCGKKTIKDLLGCYTVSSYKVEIKTLVENMVWTVQTPYPTQAGRNHPNTMVLDIQSTLVRSNSKNDDLILFNPGLFDDETVKRIGKLGNVAIIITTTGGHGKCIAHVTKKYYPQAKVYGVDSKSKHGHPEVKWTGFVDDDNQLFDAAFMPHVRFAGHPFRETVFFHRPSGSIIGITDTVICVGGPTAPSMRIYAFGFGLWRGEASTSYMASQNYIFLLPTDRKLYHTTVQFICEQWARNANHLVLGHGGQIQGAEEITNQLKQAYGWTTKDTPSWFERTFLLPLAYAMEDLFWLRFLLFSKKEKK